MMWLRQAFVVDPSQNLAVERDIVLKDGVIIEIAQNLQPEDVRAVLGLSNSEQIPQVNAAGKYLFPGLVDAHVHLREPGQEDKEDIRSGSRAAVRGGFTSILAMANTKPVIDQRALVEFVRIQGQRAGFAKVYPVAAVTKGFKGTELVEMMDLFEGGAVAFSDDGQGIQNSEIMRLALEYAKLTACPIIAHCEDNNLAGQGVMRRGEASARLGLRGIPASAESVMVARDVLLAGETEGKLHIAHVSTKESVQIIKKAKKLGIDVTAEVNPHHLLFTDEDISLTATAYKVNPPLPTRADQEALIEGLLDGTIDMLATDHAPHTWEDKAKPFAEVPFGINALETALAAVWQGLVAKGKLSIQKLVELWSLKPAQRFGLPAGMLKIGAPADMVLFDPDYKEEISAANLESKSLNTPFLGKEMQGFPVMVWVDGKLLLENRQIIDVKN
ncbi:MAG: dihydroorotase [Peptococcaceae bacterium]|nr:dihydroorotase [Peptococcaceae bacterium]